MWEMDVTTSLKRLVGSSLSRGNYVTCALLSLLVNVLIFSKHTTGRSCGIALICWAIWLIHWRFVSVPPHKLMNVVVTSTRKRINSILKRPTVNVQISGFFYWNGKLPSRVQSWSGNGKNIVKHLYKNFLLTESGMQHISNSGWQLASCLCQVLPRCSECAQHPRETVHICCDWRQVFCYQEGSTTSCHVLLLLCSKQRIGWERIFMYWL